MKSIRYLFIILALITSMPALADCDPSDCMVNRLSIGYGPVRENDGASYRAFRLDDRMSEHWMATMGGIIGGDHPSDHNAADLDYRTNWLGASYLEVEQSLYGSIGIVRLTRQTKHLTSPYQFIITFGVHYEAVSMSYVHLSNGHTGGKNYGEDMLILAWGF